MLTYAIVLTSDNFQKWLSIFPELQNEILFDEKNKILLIYNPNSQIMRFIDCNSSDPIMKLTVEIQGGLAASTINQLLKLITKHISNTLFSTGFCEKEGNCYWEGFFIKSALREESIDQLQNDLSKIESISNYEFLNINETQIV